MSSLVIVAKAEPVTENIPNLIHQAVFLLRASQNPLSFAVIEIFELTTDVPEGFYRALTTRECKWHTQA